MPRAAPTGTAGAGGAAPAPATAPAAAAGAGAARPGRGAAASAKPRAGRRARSPERRGAVRHLPIAAWPAAERPRERLWRLGAAVLGDAELIALVLRTGTRGESALELGRRLLGLGGAAGVAGLSGFAAEDLAALGGMGQAKVAALLAALELGSRAAAAARAPARLESAADVTRHLSDMIGLDREQFRVLLLNTKHVLLGWEVVGVGGLNEVAVHPREVFKPAIRRSAAAVILAHNHPSGDPRPSEADVRLTRRLTDAGRLLGVPVLDHVVVAKSGFCSLRAAGLAEFDD